MVVVYLFVFFFLVVSWSLLVLFSDFFLICCCFLFNRFRFAPDKCRKCVLSCFVITSGPLLPRQYFFPCCVCVCWNTMFLDFFFNFSNKQKKKECEKINLEITIALRIIFFLFYFLRLFFSSIHTIWWMNFNVAIFSLFLDFLSINSRLVILNCGFVEKQYWWVVVWFSVLVAFCRCRFDYTAFLV